MKTTTTLLTTLSVVLLAAGTQARAQAYQITGTFENPNGTDTSGVGTSQFSYGVGQPTVLTFEGAQAQGTLLPGSIVNVGDLTLFNGAIVAGTGTTQVDLIVVGEGCDSIDATGTCVSPELLPIDGTAVLTFINTPNLGDPIGDSDNWCVPTTITGPPTCAWVGEGQSGSFKIFGIFGSLTVVDVLPLDDTGFVTIGTDPTSGQIFAVSMDFQPRDAMNRFEVEDEVDDDDGIVKVALLTSSGGVGQSFDATQVDVSSVTFGRTGSEATPRRSRIKDVDKDGNADLVLKFSSVEADLTCTTDRVFIKGSSFDGVGFSATDVATPTDCDDDDDDDDDEDDDD